MLLKPYGPKGICNDRMQCRDNFGRRSVSSLGSRSRTSTSRESELDEQLRQQQQQQVQQLSQQVQMMQGMLMQVIILVIHHSFDFQMHCKNSSLLYLQMYSAQMGSQMGPPVHPSVTIWINPKHQRNTGIVL